MWVTPASPSRGTVTHPRNDAQFVARIASLGLILEQPRQICGGVGVQRWNGAMCIARIA